MKDKQRSTSQVEDKHTPAPWIVRDDQIQDIHGNTIACITAGEYWNTTEGIVTKEMPWEANARLMAAAPELLKALKAVIHAYGVHEFPVLVEARERAKILITKIEGDE